LPSISNNLSEAMRRTGRDRPHLSTVALGSADEIPRQRGDQRWDDLRASGPRRRSR
jgi:hypothetical protein